MINYKKADAYFKKMLDKGLYMVKWSPEKDYVWVASEHLAVLYPVRDLPFNLEGVEVRLGLESIVNRARESTGEILVTNFKWFRGKTAYCVLQGRRLCRKDFIEILNTDILFSGDKEGLYSVFDSGRLVGFACGYLADPVIWEELE